MTELRLFLLTILIVELMGVLMFAWLRKRMQPNGSFSWFSLVKGILERWILLLGLHLGHDTVLVLFGALKLGTRISQQKDERVSNDYFLVGNLLSVLMVFLVRFVLCQVEDC